MTDDREPSSVWAAADEPDAEPKARRSIPLGWPVLLVWVVVYLLLMAQGGWAWKGAGFLDFGSPPGTALDAYGAAVPAKIQDGAWQRLFLGFWLQRSLLGLVLLGWFWASTARTLVSIVGAPRTWLLFVAGGVAGALTHAFAHPESGLPYGAGPFDPIAAGIGAQVVWGFGSLDARAKRIRNSALVSVVLIGILTWYFTRDTDRGAGVRALIGFEAMLGAFAAGVVLLVLFGPRRSAQPAGRLTAILSVVALGAVVAAAVVQAPLAVASGDRKATKRFLETLRSAEYAASSLRDQREATDAKRARLQDRLYAVLQSDFLEDFEGEEAVRSYVAAMQAYTKPVRLPYMARDPCRKAFRAWYAEYEKPLRERVGLRLRYPSEHYWERD